VSVRTKLVLLFFSITALAVGFVYLYVVPQLSSKLTSERLERLESDGNGELARLQGAARRGLEGEELASLVRRAADNVDSRITLLGLRHGNPAFVIADSEFDRDGFDDEYPSASGAAASGAVSSGVSTIDGSEVGETAFPMAGGYAGVDAPGWVIVLSTPLQDIRDNVALVRRQTLIAGGIALVLALVAAFVVASFHARRLRRLEDAAQRVADGDFDAPIPVGGRDEVGQLARALEEMRTRLLGLENARREFIANASHELRTPIASLGGFVELLDEDPEPDAESRREFVRTMRGQIERLTKLSTDLLDLSRLDADALSLRSERVDLVAVAREVATEFAAAAEGHSSAIHVVAGEAEPLAQADRTRTAQVLRILIDNALKHTAAGTEITISAPENPTAPASPVRITVADDGAGIDSAARERIFDRFYTADSVGGSGLGLAIARELSRAMGGDVVLEPAGAGGAAFSLVLPLGSGPAAAAPGGPLGATA
jgi:signal transduction histidine kinase